MTQTATQTPAWQHTIAGQLHEVPDDATHLIVNLAADGTATLLDHADTKDGAVVSADDHATKVDGEVMIVDADLIRPLATTAVQGEPAAVSPLALAPTGADEDVALPEGTAGGPDADTGQLFKVPRAAVLSDDSDPTILKVSFSGSIELDRTVADDVRVYNALQEGRDVELHLDAYVSSRTKTKRRDKEGNIEAIAETKSLVVHTLGRTDEL